MKQHRLSLKRRNFYEMFLTFKMLADAQMSTVWQLIPTFLKSESFHLIGGTYVDDALREPLIYPASW